MTYPDFNEENIISQQHRPKPSQSQLPRICLLFSYQSNTYTTFEYWRVDSLIEDVQTGWRLLIFGSRQPNFSLERKYERR